MSASSRRRCCRPTRVWLGDLGRHDRADHRSCGRCASTGSRRRAHCLASREAFRLTLVASALNVFLPAKAGDLVKSYFVATRSNTAAGVALSMAVYERLCDLFGLITCCLVLAG